MLTGMRKVPGMEETGHSHDASFFPTNWALFTRQQEDDSRFNKPSLGNGGYMICSSPGLCPVLLGG
jgi:hypothetical protein